MDFGNDPPPQRAKNIFVPFSEDFIKQVLQGSEQAPADAKMLLAELLQRVAHLFDLLAELLRQRKRSRPVTEARSVLCYFAVRERRRSGERVGRMFNISRAAVSFSAGREEVLVAEDPILREKIGTPNTQVEKGRSFLKKPFCDSKRNIFGKALATTGSNLSPGAQMLEISLRKLFYKIKEFDFE